MKGIVFKSTGSFYDVRLEDGQHVNCRLRGVMRKHDSRFTNPVAVGDIVEVEHEDDYLIKDVHPRDNYIVRRSIKLSKEAHILAANIDQAILFVTLKDPLTFQEFIDRYLVTAGAYHIPVLIVFNKVDLYNEKELEKLSQFDALYTQLGYECFSISALKNDNFDQLVELMKDKTSLISGHSGVGKSTFLNRLDSELRLSTSEVSEAHASGKHTTTFAEMHEIENIGFVIDTPGIKGLGVIDIPKEELAHYFPEMLELREQCKFHNCVHLEEPKCAVLEAVEEGGIDLYRYRSYLSIFHEEKDKYR